MRNSQRGLTLVEVVIASAIMLGLVSMTFLIMNQSSEDHEQNARKLDMDHRSREVLNDIAREARMANSAMIWAWDSRTGSWAQANMQVPAATQTEYDSIRFQMLAPGNFDLQGFYEATKGTGQDTNRRWSRRITYRWVEDTGEIRADGLDNDNDGLADEGRIERIEEDWVFNPILNTWQWSDPPTTSVICDNVPWDPNALDAAGNSEPKGWLKFSLVEPDYIIVTLRLEVLDPKSPSTDFASGDVETFRRTVTTRVETRNN